eukprot:COSAG05_NODE_13748_length_419_cov_0.809375_2_plen_30_part_01
MWPVVTVVTVVTASYGYLATLMNTFIQKQQ